MPLPPTQTPKLGAALEPPGAAATGARAGAAGGPQHRRAAHRGDPAPAARDGGGHVPRGQCVFGGLRQQGHALAAQRAGRAAAAAADRGGGWMWGQREGDC